MNYPGALAWIYATQERGIKLGLDRVRDFLQALGWDGGKQRFIHVAGTNGKGSVCAMVESVGRAAGYRTGLFTSPHLVTFRERIRINGAMLEPELIAAELTRIRNVCEAEKIEPTFFEAATALALMIFQQQDADLIALETGLGGRLDSTNVVRPEVCVITSIGLDHTAMLGSTLAEIAWEKAGIIKPGVPVITGPMPAEAAEVIAAAARERNAPLALVDAPVNSAVGLAGSHQQINAALALCALKTGGFAVSEAGLSGVQWPGRFQRGGARFILDGAHNPEAARRLVKTWREEIGAARTPVILGILRDKEAAAICEELAPIAERFLIVPVQSPRATPVEELLRIASGFRPARIYETLRDAMDEIPDPTPPALITGSLFLMGEALVALGLAEDAMEISAQ